MRTLPNAPATKAAAAALGAVLLLSACSSGSRSTGTASPASATPSAASTRASPTAAGPSAPADPAAATAQVTRTWEDFFSPSTPLSARAALLEDGDQLRQLLQGFATDPRVGRLSVTVANVQFTSATTATVTYDLSLQGQTVQPAAPGQAVLENGGWKVSKATLCGLVVQAGITAAPGCA
ncbi:hypothetical protein ACFYNO_40320 [Kitasatospora sp. NPDC006697]|uniref:hypothetical protein n=1 Tax=Kitasatospora sp. NPDC006697 TaxID=3364020 RepID=UPI0036CC3DAA